MDTVWTGLIFLIAVVIIGILELVEINIENKTRLEQRQSRAEEEAKSQAEFDAKVKELQETTEGKEAG